MKKLLITLAAFVAFSATMSAQTPAKPAPQKPATPYTTDPATWAVCKLGASPIAPGPAPKGAEVFKTNGGPVLMTEAGPGRSVPIIRCRLAPGTEVYRLADGVLRDVASNQPFWPVNWDVAKPTAPPPAPAPAPQATTVVVPPSNVTVNTPVTVNVTTPALDLSGLNAIMAKLVDEIAAANKTKAPIVEGKQWYKKWWVDAIIVGGAASITYGLTHQKVTVNLPLPPNGTTCPTSGCG